MTHNEEVVLSILKLYLSDITAKCVLELAVSRAQVDLAHLRPEDAPRLLAQLERGARLYLHDPERYDRCRTRLAKLLDPSANASQPLPQRLVVPVLQETDIVMARTAGRKLCADIGFSQVEQTKVATAISELARNILQYAGTGEVTLSTLTNPHAGIEVLATDQGPGIEQLDRILRGDFQSERGLGLGLRGTRKLMDEFEIQTSIGEGTEVRARKYLR